MKDLHFNSDAQRWYCIVLHSDNFKHTGTKIRLRSLCIYLPFLKQISKVEGAPYLIST